MVMNTVRTAFALLFVMSFNTPGSAIAGDFKVFLDYACLGIDGVPIPRNSQLEASCCGSNATSDETCSAGFFSIIPDSMVESESMIAGAYNLIDQSIQITGNASDLTGTPAPIQTNPTQSSTSNDLVDTDVSALFSLPESVNKPDLPQRNLQPLSGRTQGSGGNSFSAQSSDSGSLGLSSGRSRKSKQGSLLGSESEPTGAYLPNGAQKAVLTASNGPTGVTSSLSEGSFEYGKGAEGGMPGGSSVSGSEDLIEGSTEDAPDYLRRIHSKDSIFKIVSKRYQREVARKHVEVSRKK